MLRHWLLLFPFLLLASFNGCSEDPDDEWTDDDDDPSVVDPGGDNNETDSPEQTLDGAPAFARFDVSQIDVPAIIESPVTVTFYTNLIEPLIKIETDAVEDFVFVADIVYSDVEDERQCEMTIDVIPNTPWNDEQGNLVAGSRQATLSVTTAEGKSLATLKVLQAEPPFCQLNGNVQSTFSTLSFPFTANEAMAKVRYFLSEQQLDPIKINDNFYDTSIYREQTIGEGQTDFTLDFDGLYSATPYYLYVRPLDEEGYSADGRFYMEYTASTAAGESEQDLVLLVSANPANNFTVYIPFRSSSAVGTLDWGDGTVETLAGGGAYRNIGHTYNVTSTTEFEVRFSGKMTHMEFTLAAPAYARENTLLGILQWGYTGLEEIDLGSFTSLSYVAPDTQGAFRTMKHFGVEPYGGSFTETGITEIPAGFFDYATEVTSFDYTFGGCEKLASLPAGLFKNCKKVTSFQRTFINCTSLTELPADLFGNCSQVTTFQFTFTGCSGLKAIPSGLFDACTKVQSFEGTFENCSSLTSIPAGLFASNKEVMYVGICASRDADSGYRGGVGVFRGCTGLTELPAGLFASFTKLIDASYAFYGCKGLTSLPADLFSTCTSLQYLENAFQNCSGLKSLPVSLFDNNRQLRIIGELFSGCNSLSGESPYTVIGDGTKVHLYERSNYPTEFVAPNDYIWCFRYCTGLSDYDAMPESWN